MGYPFWSFGVPFGTPRVQFVFVWGGWVHHISKVDLFVSEWGGVRGTLLVFDGDIGTIVYTFVLSGDALW